MKSTFFTKHPLALAAAVAVMVTFGGMAASANHGGQRVVINGKLLNAVEMVAVERAIGTSLRSGNYWYNASNGYWGVVNGPLLGRITPQRSYARSSSGTTRNYNNGSWGYRNSTTGTGMLYDPNAGGNWRDRIWVSPR